MQRSSLKIMARVVEHQSNGILLIATNPLDALTHYALQLSGMPARRVIGSGTVLDTARFLYLLSQHFGVDSRSFTPLSSASTATAKFPCGPWLILPG